MSSPETEPNSEEIEQVREPVFPGSLSPEDIELVILQCENQGADRPEEIEGFAQAYHETKQYGDNIEEFNSLTPEEFLSFVHRLQELIEPELYTPTYRHGPARFPTGNEAMAPGIIADAMIRFSKFYTDGTLNAEELYEMYENIHPQIDGNGRVGDLLWKLRVTQETGQWPLELPPDLWGGGHFEEHEDDVT